MITLLKRFFNDVNRDLNNIDFALRFYAIAFVAVVVFFGFILGIPLISTLQKKWTVIKEMDSLNTALRANYVQLKEAHDNIADNSKQIELLNTYMPVDASVQSYMVDFIDAVSTVNYSVVNFSQPDLTENKNAIELQINLEGSSYPTELVSKVESLKRITSVKSVLMYNSGRIDDTGYAVTLRVLIYVKDQ